MKDNFQEIIKQKTDKELEIISKDYVFYSEDERFIALNELESRNSFTKELLISKQNIELSKEIEEDANPPHRIKIKDLYPQKSYLFTPLLIYANVFVFILMVLFGVNVFSPSVDALVQWGGNIRYLTINGQLWRLFTSVFLHGGILHLAFNMYALLYVGSILEKVIGKNQFIFAYLISGIAASVSSLVINENIVSVGASGAIFGLFGVLLPLLSSKAFNFTNISVKKMLLNSFLFVLYNIMVGFYESGIDNAAHIGGFITGVIIGGLYCMITKEKIRQIPAHIILTIILGILSAFAVTNVSNKFGEYDIAIKEFAVNEQKALWMYQENFDNIPDDKIKERLTKEGVDIWEKNILSLQKIKNNEYPDFFDKQIDMLINYSILRKEACLLMIKLLEFDFSFEIEQELEEIHTLIENKLKELEIFLNETTK